MTGPLCIDLFCGCFGWSAGWLELGGCVVGFDIAHEPYHGSVPKNAALVLQDVRTIHGRQFKGASLILASPPCQAYSYRSMPWKRAKALPPPDNSLFEACFRIQREACEAAGHHIPLVVENVCGAQKWVGRARWHYGSFYLWGDVPALMPITRRAVKVPTMGAGWYPPGHPKHVPGLAFNGHAERNLKATKNDGGSWFAIAHNTTSGHGQNPVNDGVKFSQSGAAWFDGKPRDKMLGNLGPAAFGSKSSTARKAASAHIAKIPFELARWIARAWKP